MFRLQLLATVNDLDTMKSNPQLHTAFLYSKKGKSVPLQAWTGPEGS